MINYTHGVPICLFYMHIIVFSFISVVLSDGECIASDTDMVNPRNLLG